MEMIKMKTLEKNEIDINGYQITIDKLNELNKWIFTLNEFKHFMELKE
jgi:hypothetical protein